MNRKHTLAISLLLGLAIAAGAFAATRSGQASTETTTGPLPNISLAEANARLDRYEATLDRLLDRAGRGSGEGGAGQSAATVPATAPIWDDSGPGSDDDSGHDDDSGPGSDDDHGHDDDSGPGSDDDHGRGGDDD